MKALVEYIQKKHIEDPYNIQLEDLKPGDFVTGIGKYTKEVDEERLKSLYKIRENDGEKLWFEWCYGFDDGEILTNQCVYYKHNWIKFRSVRQDEQKIVDQIEEKIKSDKRFQDAIANKKVDKFTL